MEGEAYWEIEWHQHSMPDEREILEDSFERAEVLKTWNLQRFNELKNEYLC